MDQWLTTIVSVAVGGVVTWLAAWVYYRKASAELTDAAAELRAETARVRQMVDILARALEVAKVIAINRDARGEMIGIVIRGSGSMTVAAPTIRGEGTVSPPPARLSRKPRSRPLSPPGQRRR